MKAGDIVRFRDPKPINYSGMTGGQALMDNRPWVIGLLVEYHTWEKIATVLYAGNMVRIRAADVTKTGKKDELNNDKCR
jgi:hypothetical protein